MRLTREPRDRAMLALDASVGYTVAGRLDKAIGVLEDGISALDESDSELRWRLQAQLISFARLDIAHAAVAARHLAQLPRQLAGTTPGERLILAELAWTALITDEPVDQVAAIALRAFGGGRLIAEQPGGALYVLSGVWALALSEQHRPAMQAYDQLIATAQRTGSPIRFALISSRRSQLHYLRGEIPDAIADALLEAGDIDGARAALAASGFGETIPEGWQFFPLIQSRGRLRIADGHTQAGIDDMLTGQRVLARCGIANPAGAPCRSAAALALAHLGRRAEAQELLADELAAARRFGAPGTLGIALRAAGLVEGGTSGIDLLRQAVAQLERSPARLQHARALADLGAALRRNGRRREAQQTLRQALDLADRCGGKAVADQARSELVITGARPRRSRISGVQALTASERRVAQLAADGLTNRQIAQALFVSHPTVVTHLSHCYQKLNITSRGQLADALATPGDRPALAASRAAAQSS
jgi:DNA-binding CsgD family transcriptional regulator